MLYFLVEFRIHFLSAFPWVYFEFAIYGSDKENIYDS